MRSRNSWCRIWLLLLLANVQLGEYEEAGKVERRIAEFLSNRSKFDHGAERQLYRLLAISEMHSAAEVAKKRIGQAMRLLRKKISSHGFADLYEYFICLSNKSGNAVTVGEFASAIDAAAKALLLSRDYPTIRFPARWAPANNMIVAAVLDGRIKPSEGATCLGALAERFPNVDDNLLIYSNLGSLELLSGRYDAAIEAFNATRLRLERTPDIDPYYRYHFESNYAIALYLSGEREGEDIWNACQDLIHRVMPALRSDLVSRHAAVTSAFRVGATNNTTWSFAIESAASVSPHFRPARFPSGIFLSDIQIWSGV